MLSDDIAIRVRGLGKRYLVPQRHHEIGAAEPTWRDRLKEFFPELLGAGERDYFWALRDVSFDVRRGEVFGIVGENGSGKSTLLKILSGVTPPTEGEVELRGRVGSLLEVGTGFHPDLTGRENVFFNGSLLGIPREEIRAKLADIIEFSGIGEFIDVPVKRYSSGMYVRLAYSVAALLQSDILILDEVLAVGDAAFREKSEDNITRATAAGRSVLFVSHNQRAVASMCNRAIILHKGKLMSFGNAKEIIAEYLSKDYLRQDQSEESEPGTGADQDGKEAAPKLRATRRIAPRSWADISRTPRFSHPGLPEPTHVLKWASAHDRTGARCATFNIGDEVRFRIGYEGIDDPDNTYFSVLIHNSLQDRMATIHSTHMGCSLKIGPSGVVECLLPMLLLGEGLYSVMVDTGYYNFDMQTGRSRDCVTYALYIQVKNADYLKGQRTSETTGTPLRSQWRCVDAVADENGARTLMETEDVPTSCVKLREP